MDNSGKIEENGYVKFEKMDNKPYIKINLESNYQDFPDFYSSNKNLIFKNIVKLFDGLTRTRKKELKLIVISIIDGFEWSSEFIFDKTRTDLLINDILPYFEENEEYEICAEIRDIIIKLEKKKHKTL